jgi:AbrB family looped-hinge helix DNA binding protein
MHATLTVKGQVVIPAEIRKRLKLKKGTRLSVEEQDGRIVMAPQTREYFDRMSGILKGAGLLESLMASRAEDLAREEAKIERRKGHR